MAREAQRIEDDAGGSTQPEQVAVGSAVVAATERLSSAQDPPGADGSSTAEDVLPDPAETARALALCVAEILSGAREVDSIARWITEDVQRHLQQRAAFAARARSVARRRNRRPSIRVGSVLVCRPADGVAEVSVVVHTRSHARAVAIRLEERAGRWRATAIGML
ncbi:Rv3235 family protein [Curtobacterium sp. PhB136]|uniref:Rv3235 family protein n=1 Tax=Curtobacterium sp. PhB136 TaxID=2485181 RepID=UPI0010504CB4|nr:Rv3235 family protein [Curtobacterium sp. PhB136]TCK59744.1 hypothetical protein EDF27_3607 [Curtobacterium sp. PhB136]